jgi:CheY-like chemotaxis protein
VRRGRNALSAKILLADDSNVAQRMGKEILSAEGFEVVTVSNGSAALKKLRESRPDLVLADVFMPGNNGYEVCQAIKADAGLTDIPVVLLVGAMEPYDPEEGRKVKADGVITKPLQSSTLVSIVKQLLAPLEGAPAESKRAVRQRPPALEPPPLPSPVHEQFSDEGPEEPAVPEPKFEVPEDGADQPIAAFEELAAPESAPAVTDAGHETTVRTFEEKEVSPAFLSSEDPQAHAPDHALADPENSAIEAVDPVFAIEQSPEAVDDRVEPGFPEPPSFLMTAEASASEAPAPEEHHETLVEAQEPELSAPEKSVFPWDVQPDPEPTVTAEVAGEWGPGQTIVTEPELTAESTATTETPLWQSFVSTAAEAESNPGLAETEGEGESLSGQSAEQILAAAGFFPTPSDPIPATQEEAGPDDPEEPVSTEQEPESETGALPKVIWSAVPVDVTEEDERVFAQPVSDWEGLVKMVAAEATRQPLGTSDDLGSSVQASTPAVGVTTEIHSQSALLLHDAESHDSGLLDAGAVEQVIRECVEEMMPQLIERVAATLGMSLKRGPQV